MNRLTEIGFEHIGHWFLRSEKLSFKLYRDDLKRNILYAFVSDGEVKYVGQTVRSLRNRMAGYMSPKPTQGTNIQNNLRLCERLRAGIGVDILALADDDQMYCGPFHLNRAAGLEYSIIAIIKPEWNGRNKRSQNSSTVEVLVSSNSTDSGRRIVEVSPKAASAESCPSFRLKLHDAYYSQGMFNVGVEYGNLLGEHNEKIEIFCEESTLPFAGKINRKAQRNGTPRVIGKGLRGWFRHNISPLQEVMVHVISPTSIRIEPIRS